GSGAGAFETMTVLKSDLLATIKRLNEEDGSVELDNLDELREKTIELSTGPGTGVVLDPAFPQNLFDRFWVITDLVVQVVGNPDTQANGEKNDLVVLTVLNPSVVDPSLPAVTAPLPGTT